MAINIMEKFAASGDRLWEIVGTPDRVDWVPGVESCDYDGDVRRLAMPGAGDIEERILSLDGRAMRIEYSCIKSAAPLDHHLASIEVKPDGDSCVMHWATEVRPAEFEPFIEQSMQGCLARLHELLDG